MKGVLLAGGRGSRLRPITHTMTKHLIPLANKPILYHGLEALRDAGIKDLAIVVGCKHPDFPGSLDTRPEIEEAVGDGSRWGLRVCYLEQDAPRGIAHAVWITRDFVGDDPFVVFLGDNFVPSGIADFTREFELCRPNAMILLCQVPNPQDFGVAELREGRVVGLEEKPKQPKSDLALVGVYLFDHHLWQAIPNIKPSWRGELEITHAIQWLIDQGLQVQAHTVRGWWKDTGTLADLLEANRTVLDSLEHRLEGKLDEASRVLGRVVVEPGAELVRSTISGPAIIGTGCRVVDSFLGPYVSVGPGVVVEESELANSIVLEGATISRIPGKIMDSLIGKEARITRSSHKRSSWQFMLGDKSQVTVG